MDREKLEYARHKYGTPLYVFDLDEAWSEAERVRGCLGADIGICYAMKANPFIAGKMSRTADRIEVCSAGEFEICRKLGIPPEKMFISGVLKKREDLNRILDYCRGNSRYTVESPSQFQQFVRWSEENETVLRLYPRLTSGNQFGVDEAALCEMIMTAESHPYVEISGIHYFSGTQKKTPDRQEKEIRYLDGVFGRLKEGMGFVVKELEYGSGTAVSYFEGKDVQTYGEEGLKALGGYFRSMKWQGKVTVELGRALAAMCGSYLTEVGDVKTSGGINYCIVDGGSHQLNFDGQIKGMYRPYVWVCPEKPEEEAKSWTVCGSLCTVNDVLCREIPLAGVEQGAALVFERAGAYSCMEGMALFLSHELPTVVLYEEETGWTTARQERQTWPLNYGAEEI